MKTDVVTGHFLASASCSTAACLSCSNLEASVWLNCIRMNACRRGSLAAVGKPGLDSYTADKYSKYSRGRGSEQNLVVHSADKQPGCMG